MKTALKSLKDVFHKGIDKIKQKFDKKCANVLLKEGYCHRIENQSIFKSSLLGVDKGRRFLRHLALQSTFQRVLLNFIWSCQ